MPTGFLPSENIGAYFGILCRLEAGTAAAVVTGPDDGVGGSGLRGP